MNKSWDVNYGQGGVAGGANIPLTVPAGGAKVTFYYDNATHWVTTNLDGPIVTAAGDFQSELGCPGDWSPDCLRSWLEDPDGDGVYTFTTTGHPGRRLPGQGCARLVVGRQLRRRRRPRRRRTSPSPCRPPASTVTFSYVASTHVLTVLSGTGLPSLTHARRRIGCRASYIAWNADTAAALSHLPALRRAQRRADRRRRRASPAARHTR